MRFKPHLLIFKKDLIISSIKKYISDYHLLGIRISILENKGVPENLTVYAFYQMKFIMLVVFDHIRLDTVFVKSWTFNNVGSDFTKYVFSSLKIIKHNWICNYLKIIRLDRFATRKFKTFETKHAWKVGCIGWISYVFQGLNKNKMK